MKTLIALTLLCTSSVFATAYADDISDLHDRVDETWDKAVEAQTEAREMNKNTNNKLNAVQQTLYEESVLRGQVDGMLVDKQASFSKSLSETSQRLDMIDAWRSQIDNRISDLDDKLTEGVAGIAAMSNIPTPAISGSVTVGAGVGHFGGTTAIAVGAATYLENNVSLKGSVATAGSEVVVGAGIGYTFD